MNYNFNFFFFSPEYQIEKKKKKVVWTPFLISAKTGGISFVGSSSWRNLKVPKPPNSIHLILHTQKLSCITLLYLPIHIVQEHVRHTHSRSRTCHHRRRVYRRHSPRRIREIPSWRVDHYHVPFLLVHFFRQLR